MPELAYFNDAILPSEDACVPIEDRGYQFSDAVYEYLTSYDGRLSAVEEHLDRLAKSMQAISFPTVSRDQVRASS